jgi:hypothetical protein
LIYGDGSAIVVEALLKSRPLPGGQEKQKQETGKAACIDSRRASGSEQFEHI